MTDLYNILNVPNSATTNTIKKSFRKLSYKFHPNRYRDIQKFKEILTAYNVLKDKEKRQLYDKENRYEKTNSIYNKILDEYEYTDEKCDNIVDTINITLENIYRNEIIEKEVEIDNICYKCYGFGVEDGDVSECNRCDGLGNRTISRNVGTSITQNRCVRCDKCDGNKYFFKEGIKCKKCLGNKIIRRKVKLNIDCGKKHGQKLTFKEKGNEKIGYIRGDIIIIVVEETHPIFKRINVNDLYMRKEINLVDALSNSVLVFEHMDGRKIYIDNNNVIQPKEKKVIAGEGLKKGNSDLVIEFDIIFPKKTVNQLEKIQLSKMLSQNYSIVDIDTNNFHTTTFT